MQSEGRLPPGVPKRYPNAFAAYGIIARQVRGGEEERGDEGRGGEGGIALFYNPTHCGSLAPHLQPRSRDTPPPPLPSRPQEGIAGLWTGLSPNIMRNAIINAAELASYDQARGN